MRFDGSATTTLNGVGIVLSCEDGDTISLSFKLGFSCSNNTAEYEAYLTGLTVALSIGVKHMRVLGDFNLVVSQVKGDFALREQSLVAYRTWAQRLEQEFQTFSIEYAQRSENRFANVLATLGSQVPFEGRDTLIRIGKQEHSIIKILQKVSPGESRQWDWRSEIKEKNERGKTWGKYQRAEGIRSNRRGTIQEVAWRDPVQMYRREGRKAKIRKATYPSLWDCRKDQPI